MYAWIMSPDTIPKAYNDWWVFLPRTRFPFSPMSASRIQHASKVPPEAIPMHRQLVRTGRYDAKTPLTSLSQRVCEMGEASTRLTHKAEPNSEKQT